MRCAACVNALRCLRKRNALLAQIAHVATPQRVFSASALFIMAECSESFVQQECRLATFPFEVAFVYDQLFGIHTQGGPAILIRLLTRLRTGAARFFLTQCTNMGGKYTKLPRNYQMTMKYTKWTQYIYITSVHRIYQPFPFQGPPKFTQIGIFVLKMYLLATLLRTDSLIVDFHAG
jgi:hypothetical protein